MIKSVIKNGELYLKKRKWRDGGYYLYYFTNEINEAILLSHDIASIWFKDILNNKEVQNSGIFVKDVEILLKEENEFFESGQYIIVDVESNTFVESIKFSLISNEFLGYKYTQDLGYANYLNSISLKNYLSHNEDNKLIVKSVLRKEIV